MAEAGHLRHQALPARINRCPLQHSFDGKNRLALQILAQCFFTSRHQPGVTPTPEPNLNKIPYPHVQQIPVGVGEYLTFPSCFEPYIQPVRCVGRPLPCQ